MSSNTVTRSQPRCRAFPAPIRNAFPNQNVTSKSIFAVNHRTRTVLGFGTAGHFDLSLTKHCTGRLRIICDNAVAHHLPNAHKIGNFILRARIRDFTSSLRRQQIMSAVNGYLVRMFSKLIIRSSYDAHVPSDTARFRNVRRFW